MKWKRQLLEELRALRDEVAELRRQHDEDVEGRVAQACKETEQRVLAEFQGVLADLRASVPDDGLTEG